MVKNKKKTSVVKISIENNFIGEKKNTKPDHKHWRNITLLRTTKKDCKRSSHEKKRQFLFGECHIFKFIRTAPAT